MDDREWACKFVGWPERGANVVPLYDGKSSAPRSIADLAEAVRVKWLEMPVTMDENDVIGLALVLLRHGPDAFIAAVREVVGMWGDDQR